MSATPDELRSAAAHSLRCFILSTILFGTVHHSTYFFGQNTQIWGSECWGPALYFCLVNLSIRYWYKDFIYEVSVRSVFLGFVFATGLFTALQPNLSSIGIYVAVLSFFHYSEFYVIGKVNPESLSIDSFILNHSVQYGVAAVASWCEWGIEYYFFSGMKQQWPITYLGLALCIGGEILRKGAILTAQKNFNHIVQSEKRRDHKLVTHGLYGWCRHPSYVGWFYWSVGTQLVMVNPICTLLYALASWSFFNERVFAEEYTLLQFFGAQYKNYQRKVPTGLPFIKGYIIE